MDSPSRQTVPAFGSWTMHAPGSPIIEYTEVFARARANRLGSMPADDYADDEYYPHDDSPNYSSSRRIVHRQSSRKNFLQYFVCGARA